MGNPFVDCNKVEVDTQGPGIPPMIEARDDCDRDGGSAEASNGGLKLTRNSSFGRLKKLSNSTSNDDNDGSSSDETYPVSYTDCSDDDDDDCSAFSTETYHTNDSTRDLLNQCRQRMERQSIYEEVKSLRSDVQRYKQTAETALRQKECAQDKCNALEHQLARATDIIRAYKLKELRWNDERAERERDFMNQLNDACSGMERNEKNLMDEIVKRDMKIIELQNERNEDEMRRMSLARNIGTNADPESNYKEAGDDWGDDSAGHFI